MLFKYEDDLIQTNHIINIRKTHPALERLTRACGGVI